MKIALLPINVRIGDFSHILKIHQEAVRAASANGADLAVFPELSLVGYPPRDLLFRESFLQLIEQVEAEFTSWLGEEFPKMAVIYGSVERIYRSNGEIESLANVAVFHHEDVREVRAKTLIPFYDVFTENRYFTSAREFHADYSKPIQWGKYKLGLVICEDSWVDQTVTGKKVYFENPTQKLVKAGADFIINLSASPFEYGKRETRRMVIEQAAKESKTPIAYVNYFGAQDELIFDGDAFVVSREGEILAQKKDFSVDPLIWKVGEKQASAQKTKDENREQEELHFLKKALVRGIRDYAKKNHFTKLVLGISGGIDSALVAVLASEALGAENVIGLMMPSKFSSSHSVEDADELANNLKLQKHHVPIKMLQSTAGLTLKPFFEGLAEDVTEENIQSRLRGLLVMAFANKFQALALATGNKSEFAMGYSTLYGDMCGALAPIGDLFKGDVYRLAHFCNGEKVRIPERTFTKPPSAELRPNQKDQDTLPPYELLDSVLKCFIEEECDADAAYQFLSTRFPDLSLEQVQKLERSMRIAEYKRKQAPPILRVSKRAFGAGRAYPLTCKY